MAGKPVNMNAWTKERPETPGHNILLDVVSGIKDVGSAKIKDITKHEASHLSVTKTSNRSQKALRLQTKLLPEKPVERSYSQFLDSREKHSQAHGPHFLPSENPTSTLLSQLNSGQNRLNQEQQAFLDRVTSADGLKQVPIVDVGCGSLFGTPQSASLPEKPPLGFEKQDRTLPVRKPVPIRKSKSLLGRPAMWQRPVTMPNLGSQSSVSSEGSTGSGGSGITSVPRGVKQPAAPSKPVCHHASLRRMRRDAFPVYDLEELEVGDNQVDLVIPGGIGDPMNELLGELPEYTPSGMEECQDTCNCCDQCLSPYKLKQTTSAGSVAIVRRPTGSSYGHVGHCSCNCKGDNFGAQPTRKHKLVQYREKDVIKTYDWLNELSQETEL